VLQWLGEGVRVPWNERGPPAPFHHGVASFTSPERSWLTAERDRCLATGAWQRATCQRFVSRAFVVYHKGKPRLVVDLRWLNEHCEKRTCKFESLSTLRRLARRNDWMFSLDMTDAYHHISFHPECVPYFTFALETDAGVEYFSTSALNFGWTLSPYIFTTVMATVVRYLRNPAVATRPRYGARQRHAPPVRARSRGGGDGVALRPLRDGETTLAAAGVLSAAGACSAGSASEAGSFGSVRGALARGDRRWAARSSLSRLLLEHHGVDGSCGLSEASSAMGDAPLAARRLPRWRRRRERPAERAKRRIIELGDASAARRCRGAELQPPPALARRALVAAQVALDALTHGRSRCGWPAEAQSAGRWLVHAERAALRELERIQPRPTSTQRAQAAAAAGLQGLRTLPWLDDFAFFRQGSFEEASAARDHVGGTFGRLGLLRAEGKGQWEPSRFLEDHLGYGIDSACGLFLLTARREASLASAAHALLRQAAAERRLVRVRAVASFCGLGQSSTLALPLGRFMLRAMYDDLAQRLHGHRLGAGLVSGDELALPGAALLGGPEHPAVRATLAGGSQRAWRGHVRLGSQALQDLRWWASLRGSRHVGRAIWRRPETRELWTDASDLGWGGTIDHRQLYDEHVGSWAQLAAAAARGAAAPPPTVAAAVPFTSHVWCSVRRPPAAGFWSPDELPMHITLKELRAVRLSVEHFLPELTGRRVLLHEDNQAVVWILTNMVTRSAEMMSELRALWGVLDLHDIELRPVYIRSAANRIADFASRLAMRGDYVISRARFLALQEMWGDCTVDAFASPATAQVLRYWSESPVEGAEATDAFAQEWRGELAWAHPPPGLLSQLALFLESTGAAAQVCAPYWPGAVWYSMLLDLSDEHIVLPPGSLELVAADAPPRLASWPVVVFRVPGGRSVR
jgi:hypothetical protein